MSSAAPTLPAPTLRNSTEKLALEDLGYTLFGHGSFPSADRDGRPLSGASSILPPYARTDSALPPPEYVYTSKGEPVTLAMYMFKFGPFCPLFWIIGAFIYFMPLHAPRMASSAGSWLPDKTDAEKQVHLELLRKTELKWAKRCAYASVCLFSAIGLAIGLAVWASHRRP
ncbi:hypothetical protein CYLTODRAFT_401521 [Cylindrobasidium torrendii FP15055 ss-10]|uniref:Uncharacterized protein n=1 Tax=Cylindrobasidium torrendii FP15055 ss-10 TaxID=1314674 RepID=A0A0D7B2L3_9AGAR|nr:hypothetical protein CYLTODRAFT_401521 [Cylindrobasidium torrendii FP15055 ss-10]